MDQNSQEPPSVTPPTFTETLHRHLSLWNSLTLGFAMVSPVVGLYAIMGVQTAVTGGGWFVALALCLVMQLLVATVYAELASQFPIAGGAVFLVICTLLNLQRLQGDPLDGRVR